MRADGFAFSDQATRLERAANGLADTYPHLSARDGLTRAQRYAGLLSAAGFAGLVLVYPAAIYWAGFSVFTALILWRAGLVISSQIAPPPPDVPHLSDAELPPYSILIALYDEAATAPGLIRALKRIDYPAGKLDIHLLLEAKDRRTYLALAGLALPSNMHIHTLAPGAPQTKPRVLNYGLEFAAGKYITIYDAEDRPHPHQIRRAAETVAAAPANTMCLQAPLTAHNAGESWVAAQWALEYDIQFGLLVPALSRAGLPIPLGGTSNHFDRAALEAAGGWDAWNVTEDADMGLRFARLGWRIDMIAPPTLEEAPETLGIWAAQRSRWIKGFIQSWCVSMRAPARTGNEMGWVHWIAMQITLGGAILSALLAGPMALWLIICLALPGLHLGLAGTALLLCGYGVNILAALAAPGRWSAARALTVATLPLYWPLLSLGAARTLYGLARTPHFWAKTPHGLTAAQIDEGPLLCPPSTGSLP